MGFGMLKGLVGVAGLMVLCCGTARAEWTLLNGDFAEEKGLTVNTWTAAEGLSVTDNSGKLIKVDTRQVLSMTSDKSKGEGSGSAWRMMMRNGDVLFGEPSGVSGQSLQFTMPEMGKILVPLKEVVCVAKVAGNAGKVEAATDKDVVRLNNGDKVEGLIVNVDGAKVQIATGANNDVISDLNVDNVERVMFGGVSPARAMPVLSARISFVSGSVMTVPLAGKSAAFAWTINSVEIKDPGGKDRKASADTIASIDIVGGRVVFLTELDPAKDEQTSFMGTQWATQVNKNVLGEAMVVGKKTYSRGLGVHTKSDLVYELDGSFETLKLQVGMDDSAAPQGSADVAVVLDGKVLWESKGMKAGAASEELALPVAGGKRLELRANPALGGGKIDVLGRVDWLNVALIRK